MKIHISHITQHNAWTSHKTHLMYVFLGRDNTLPVIIAADLNGQQVECLVALFKRFKRSIGGTIADIIGIPPNICSHKIQLILLKNHVLSTNKV